MAQCWKWRNGLIFDIAEVVSSDINELIDRGIRFDVAEEAEGEDFTDLRAYLDQAGESTGGDKDDTLGLSDRSAMRVTDIT